ncbi:Aste57867_16382 [Aphanomyces stellatus]|uniref:Aste57867_16382 protein n=1 Tax=Aphanomyces stellatus TaxID=120398 RepID=A0A485L651_9STRA|nr:hypothetical protein As57867_016325 [Aphanomyces stellatus]VFT93158.1 Aste57867_16382 [Aphanomyces stellatus]
MGAHESRIKEDDQTKLMQEQENNRTPSVQVRVSADLVNSLKNGNADASNQQAPAHAGFSAEEVEKLRKEAYLKGVEDQKKRAEAEAKKNASKPPSAVDLKKQEREEQQRVKKVVEELTQKNYRAPVNAVQCSKEREACLQCYRESGSDVLKCKEVSDAFFQCSEAATNDFVKK